MLSVHSVVGNNCTWAYVVAMIY